MPRDGTLPVRTRALDLLNFFIADVQTGFGPFVAVYLTAHKWPQVQIGFVLTLGTVSAIVAQLPAGALVDAARDKRRMVSAGLLGVIAAALLLALWPAELPGSAALGERLGRNARFASIGNGLAAAVMGVTGSYLSSRAVFWLTAGLCVPALVSL